MKLYSRMKKLDCINSNDEIFENEALKEQLHLISSLYYFNLLNPSLFYYYEVKNMIGKLDESEESSYRFYETMVDIFLEKTEKFINEVSNHINVEIEKNY